MLRFDAARLPRVLCMGESVNTLLYVNVAKKPREVGFADFSKSFPYKVLWDLTKKIDEDCE